MEKLKMEQACKNEDRTLWRRETSKEDETPFKSCASIGLTKDDALILCLGGHCVVNSIEDAHAALLSSLAPAWRPIKEYPVDRIVWVTTPYRGSYLAYRSAGKPWMDEVTREELHFQPTHFQEQYMPLPLPTEPPAPAPAADREG